MFSKTCKYAIRAIIYIAKQSKKELKVSIKEISEEIDSPEHFTGKILQKLTKKGFIKSIKGPNGGFYLEEKDFELTILEIVIEIDGDDLFNECGMGLKECSEARPCPIHNDYKIIKNNLKRMLESYKIRMFVDDQNFKLTFLK